MTKDLEKEYQDLNKERRDELVNYDKKRHLELLNQQSDEFRSKLLNYSVILIDQYNSSSWCTKILQFALVYEIQVTAKPLRSFLRELG